MKYFRIKMWSPKGYFAAFRFAFPMGQRNGEYYDILSDSMQRGRHIFGKVFEISYEKERKLFVSFTSWSTPK